MKEDVASSFGDAFSGPFLAWATLAHSGILVAWWSDIALYLAVPVTVLVAFGVVVALAFGAGGTALCPTYRELARRPSNTPLPEPLDDDLPIAHSTLAAEPPNSEPALPCSPELRAAFHRIAELNASLTSYNAELLRLATPRASETGTGHREKIEQLHSMRDAAIGELVNLMGATLYHQTVQAGGSPASSISGNRHRDLCHA
ncbi:MAG: hypothetical protein IT581_07100 [Verrucomicrobiales bacterium]|nr:hypothetical protein [Verrucomicrobiales bacterium]